MGSGMRGENYYDVATMNYMAEHEIAGLKVKYSYAELLQFTGQDGSFDNYGFMRYLITEGDRFIDKNVNSAMSLIMDFQNK